MSKTILKGVVHNIFATESFGNFEKRIMYLKEQQGANVWELTFEQNDVNILDDFKPGQAVICNVEIRGREWTKDGKTRIFNTLKCVMVQREGPLEESLKAAPSVMVPPPTAGQPQQKFEAKQSIQKGDPDFIDDAPY